MTEQNDRRKKNNKVLFIFLAFFIAILLTGVSAEVDSVTCLFGLSCNPNPLTGIATIDLKNASATELGGIMIQNCSTGSFYNSFNSSVGITCGTLTGSSGSLVINGNVSVNGTIFALGNSTNQLSPIVLGAGLVSNSTVTSGVNAGALEYNNNSLFFTNLAVRRTVVQAQDVLIDNVTINNSVVETVLINIPHGANYLRVGKMEEVELQGVVSSILGAGNNNLTVKIYYAGVSIGSFVMSEASRNAVGFEIHVLTTVRSTGGSGTMVVHGNMDVEGTLSDPIVNTIATIDTTVAQNLTIKAQWSDASASNSITILQGRALSIDDN